MSCFFGAGLCGMLRLGWRQSITLLLSAAVAAVLANALRATLLFFPEADLIRLPEWSHEGTGLLLHIIAMGALLSLARHLQSG